MTTTMTKNYADRLDAAITDQGNPCLIGLDPHLDLLPEEFSIARDESAPNSEHSANLWA